tara:strand:+ start:122 stop:490 length:369 start_codon:yes stop_codon:yes gene_type:complete
MMRFISTILGTVVGMVIVTSVMAADVVGKKVFIKCIACHSLTQNRVGPSLGSIFDRKAGSAEEFKYSDAMKNSDIIWNDDTLDNFLKNPREYIEGTRMTFAGIKKDSDREALIAYLKENQIT